MSIQRPTKFELIPKRADPDSCSCDSDPSDRQSQWVVVPDRRVTLTALRLKETGHILGRRGEGFHSRMAEFTKREIGMRAIRGSCLCGGVKSEITGPLSSPLNCHCSQCRKQHGAPFRSHVRVQVEDFRWLQGEHLIKYYESAGGYLRGFCRECGSPIINRTGPNWKHPVGPSRRSTGPPACHVFVGSKAPWFEITDDLPQHAEYAPPA